ncbi:zinc finger, CCHC-type containing protein [Tanacetum coccineum]
MHFMLSSISVVYVLTTLMPKDGGENPTVEQVRKRVKWDNDDYVCRGTKGSEDGSSNPLKGQNMFDKSPLVYYVTYVSEAFFVQDDDVAWWVDTSSTALVHGRGCVDLRFSSRKVVSLLNVLHVPHIRKNLVSSSVLNNYGFKQVIESNKFVLSKHGVFIGFGYQSNHMFRLNIVSDNIGSAFMSTSKLNDSILWHARLGHVHFKRMQDMFKDGLISAFDMDTRKCQTCMPNKINKKPFQNVKRETKVLELIHSDLCDLHATPSLGNKKYFVTFIDDASRLDMRAFQAFRFSMFIKPIIQFCYITQSLNQGMISFMSIYSHKSLDQVRNIARVVKGTKERLVVYGVLEKDTKESCTKDEVYDQYSYCFNVEDDPKTFDEAMKSQDVALWDDEMDSIMGNNTWVLIDLPPGCKPLADKCVYRKFDKSGKGVIICLYVDDMLIFGTDQVQVDLTKEFLSSRFSMKDMGEDDVILGEAHFVHKTAPNDCAWEPLRKEDEVVNFLMVNFLEKLTPQLYESAGGLPSLKLSLQSCSLPGSTNAMGIETSIALVLPAREHECNGSFNLGRPPALS